VTRQDAEAPGDRISDRVDALVAAAPPLSVSQRERLAAILGGAMPVMPPPSECRPGAA
jgi:hypothetical protein